MTAPKFVSAAGLTPGKIILIGVLAVILIGVIVMQIPSASPPTASRVPKADRTQRPVANQTNRSSRQQANGQPDAKVESAPVPWPEFSLEVALAHDPFATPHWIRPQLKFDNPRDDRTSEEKDTTSTMADQQLLARLRAGGVTMVMITAGERVAQVGDTKLREGDQIGGFVVEEISTNGVVLVERTLQ